MYRQLFSFSGECIFQRNGIEVPMKNNKAKNKTFKLGTSQGKDEQPTEMTSFLNVFIGNTEEKLYGFRMDRLSRLHSAFVQEGKITLQISEQAESENKKVYVPSDVSLKDAVKTERFLFIMIKGVAPDILKPFCKMLAEIKSRKAPTPSNLNTSQNGLSQNSTKSGSNSIKAEQSIQVKKNVVNTVTTKENSTTVATTEPRIIRKVTMENDNSKFKVNRNILNDLPKQQIIPNPLKRNLNSIRRDGGNMTMEDIDQTLKKVKITYKLTKSILKCLPEAILAYILKFLTPKEYIDQKLVCKDFYSFINGLRTRLDFRGKGDVPPYIIIKYINNSPNIEKLWLGQSKFLVQRHFLEELHFHTPRLKYVDLTMYNNFSDKMALKLYRSCKAIQTLKFGYYSQITDTVLDTMHSYLENVRHVYLKFPNRSHIDKKEKLTDGSFAKFLNNYSKLQTLSLYIVGPGFFTKSFQKEIPNLTTLKLEHVLLNKEEDLQSLANIQQCVNLEFLKIGNIRMGQFDLQNFPKERAKILGTAFAALPKLQTLKLGQFTGNHVVQQIAQHAKWITKFVVSSDSLDDDGLTELLKVARNLMHLDVSRCRMIGGHCLENMISRDLRKLIVSFDEYRCRCLQQLFVEMQIYGQITITNVKNRR